MEEAERLCDRIIIVDHGKVIANDTLDAVRRLVPGVNVIELEIENPARAIGCADLRAVDGVDEADMRRQRAARHRARVARRFAPRSDLAPRARLPLLAHRDPAGRPGNGLPDPDRKERTKRMSFTAFAALVRRDLRLFFLDKRAMTMSFLAPILIGSFFGYLFGGVTKDRDALENRGGGSRSGRQRDLEARRRGARQGQVARRR